MYKYEPVQSLQFVATFPSIQAPMVDQIIDVMGSTLDGGYSQNL